MKLSRKDHEFNNPRICHIIPKHIDLERVMINLYMLLKYDGHRPTAKVGRIEIDVPFLADRLIKYHPDTLRGFASYRSVVEDWIHSDLVDMVNRGNPDKEKVASPRPLHLNAYKLRNPKIARDYGGAEQLYSMIRAVDPELVTRLRDYFGEGVDVASQDSYDGQTALDLDTLMIVLMVDDTAPRESRSSERYVLDAPLCFGQARLLCNDLRRLLAYGHVVPRPVLINYLQSAFGLHLGLYLLRLFNQLAGWVSDKSAHPTCLNCPVYPEKSEDPFVECPYSCRNTTYSSPYQQMELLVDMGEDYNSHMAELSRENCARQYARANDYIHAVLTINQLFQFAGSYIGQRDLRNRVESIPDVLRLLDNPPPIMDVFFGHRLDTILPEEELKTDSNEVQAVWETQSFSTFEKFVELVALERTHYYRGFLTKQIDSVLMKNRDTGLLRQGKGKRNERRWYLGSRLLEMLVQIAVLKPIGQGAGTGFRSRPILVNEFIQWLQTRYGLALAPNWPDATIQDYGAFNGNLRHLKTRLREIGFYTDLSDAYNAQVIRPRYSIDTEADQ